MQTKPSAFSLLPRTRFNLLKRGKQQLLIFRRDAASIVFHLRSLASQREMEIKAIHTYLNTDPHLSRRLLIVVRKAYHWRRYLRSRR